jgi:hypothetical protein
MCKLAENSSRKTPKLSLVPVISRTGHFVYAFLVPGILHAYPRLKISGIEIEQIAEVRRFTQHLEFTVGGQIDLVLQDFLDHHLHLVVRIEVDQRSATSVELNQAFLNQGRQFESATDLVHDGFFFELFEHSNLSLVVLS